MLLVEEVELTLEVILEIDEELTLVEADVEIEPSLEEADETNALESEETAVELTLLETDDAEALELEKVA